MEPIDPETLVNSIRTATSEVFEMMLSLKVTPGEAYREPHVMKPTDGVIALVGLAGQWMGTGILQCDAAFACELYSHLLAAECPTAPEGVNGDVLDAVAEIANIIVGNVKNTLEEHLGPMGMSIPTVVFGRNFMTRGGSNDPWTVVPFACECSRMLVKICLTHSPESGELRRGLPVPRGFSV
ncbi:MAG: chemotaxis protein CheX [Bryobacteraceae bacterium]